MPIVHRMRRSGAAVAIAPAFAFALFGALLFATPALAAGEGAPHLDGTTMGLLWAAPFAALLLSIAVFPLVAPAFWHHHFGKISALCAAAAVGPLALVHGIDLALTEVAHAMLLEYIPFIALVGALYVVSGGVRITGTLRGTPLVNTGMLLVGTALAGWIGTTAAAMLLVRPMIEANAWRHHRTHVFVFFIFLVANIGGALTPLGDPPLFIGFLRGVDFFWPLSYMFWPMMVCVLILAPAFFLLDLWFWRKEPAAPPTVSKSAEPLGIQGKRNLVLIVGVVGAVLLSGVWKPGIFVTIQHVPVALQDIVRTVLLVALAGLSLAITPRGLRGRMGFTWFPIVEVAKLFAGIFMAIAPVLAMLKAGTAGAFAPLIALVSTEAGLPIPAMYFWLTGGLSAVLDNAPTYLVFFNLAGGDPQVLMTRDAATLLAISAGAVFMGAMTYIGNAPNFMVLAICKERGIPMPSFFGFIGWSGVCLLPVFVVLSVLFF
jgi:Na+/H+ antiporter NhaD/arsenite permease-like protein